MKTRVTQCLGALTLFCFGLPAVAATVSLIPDSLEVQEGGVISIDLYMDVSDTATPAPDAIMGKVIIEFDSSLATYNDDFAISAPASLTSGPTAGAGSLEFDFSGAQAVGNIGTFSLTAIGDVGSIISITVDDNALLGSSFIDTLPTNKPVDPTFLGTAVTITPIPVPAAAWLMVSALGLLGFRVRQRQT